MDNSIVSSAFQTVRATILMCLIPTAALFVTLIGQQLISERLFRNASNLTRAATSVASDILLADERLTMSANLAASTGNSKWIEIYNDQVTEIESAISKAAALASKQAALRFERETKRANDALVLMERESFTAVLAGDKSTALAILESENYASNKKMLAEGTSRLVDTITTSAARRMDSVQLWSRAALLGVVGISVLAFMQLWALIKSKLRTSESIHLKAEEKLNFMARHDELTRLPNRRNFLELLTLLLEQQSASGKFVAVAMVDIDHFKDVNDTLGHNSGDELIRLMPARFKAGLAKEDAIIARLGGDEFAMAFYVRSAEEACATFERLVHYIADPLDVDGHMLSISISVGAALSPMHSSTPLELLRFADLALYEAKFLGRNRTQMFEAQFDERIRRRIETEASLKSALHNGELQVNYQPLFSQDGGSITGLESLLRWHHPILGSMSPNYFIPIAERSGLIVPIGEWVMRRVFLDSVRWPGKRIAINLSPIQLRDPGFFSSLQRMVTTTKADPRNFDFEITEGVLLEDNRRVRMLLEDLKSMGFGLTLDDFGTGYSSLSYLRKFPFDKIKIDKSFIQEIESSLEAAQIVEAIVRLGHALGLRVTAEGVETSAQHHLLKSAGCDEMQGFIFAGAYSQDKVDELLAPNSRDVAEDAATGQ